MNDIEKPRPPQTESSILNEKDFQDFLELRKINPEDVAILEELSQFPNNIFAEFHNFFNLTKEKSPQGYCPWTGKRFKSELSRGIGIWRDVTHCLLDAFGHMVLLPSQNPSIENIRCESAEFS